MMNGNKKDVIFVVTCDTSNLYATTNYDKYLVPPFLKLEGPLQKDRSVANTVQNVIHFVNGFFQNGNLQYRVNARNLSKYLTRHGSEKKT